MSDFSYSPLDPASDLTSGKKVRAGDLDFYALLRRNGADGQLFFNKRRAVLFDVEAMGALRHQLVSTLGTDLAMGVLLRFGYAQGYQDAETLENTFDWGSDADWLAAGPKLHNLEGIVYAETDHAEFDRESGVFLMRGKWHGSYEAEEHLKRFGPDNHPVCWTLAGYASGYATRFLGKDVLAIETECVGKGDPHCAWEIRLVDQWGAQADPYLNALQEIDLADQLSKSRRQLTQINAIIENSPAVLFRWRAKDWAVTYVSDNVKQFGYSPQSLLNGSVAFTSMIHPKDYGRLQQVIHHAVSSGQHQFSCEYRLVRQNGDVCWIENQMTLERAETGDVTHYQGVILDITDRKKTEEALHRLSVAVEQSANTVVITDLNGYIEYVNPMFTQTTGYSREEALGQHTRILKSGFTQPEEYKEMWQTISSGHEWRGEFRNKKKSGELYWETALISPIRDTTGEITHFLAVKEETTSRREAQLALAKRAVELETVFRVSAAAASILNVDALIQTVADMTKDNFGLYHAHIYLLNAAGNSLDLAAGAGKIGKTMVKQGWSIPVDRTDSIVAQAGRTRSGVISNDVQNTPEFLPNPLLPDTRSELAVPMLAGNRLMGVLDVQSDVVDYFTEDNLRIHSTLAAQVAVAVQNANFYQQTQTTLSEIEALYNASRRINESVDLQEIVAAVAEGGSVQVVDRILLVYFEYNAIKELESIVVAANWADAGKSATPVGTRYPKHVFPVVNLLQRAESLFVDDIQNDERVDLTTLDTFYRLNIRSLAVLPLWAGRRQIGALLLESAEVHQYTERQMAPYISLASQVGVTVENRRLLEETRRALAEVEAVQRRYTVQAWQSYENRDAAPGYQHVRQGVLPLNNDLPPEIDQAISSKQTTVISSAGTPPTQDSTPSDAAKASLIVPLKVRNEIIGVLGLQEAGQNREWTPEEIALVEAVAEQMALAAENLRLLDETQRAAWRDQIVSESTAQVWSSAEIEDVMKTAVTQLADKLRASEVVIRLGTDEQLLND